MLYQRFLVSLRAKQLSCISKVHRCLYILQVKVLSGEDICHSSPRGGQRIVYPYQVGSSPIYGAKQKSAT